MNGIIKRTNSKFEYVLQTVFILIVVSLIAGCNKKVTVFDSEYRTPVLYPEKIIFGKKALTDSIKDILQDSILAQTTTAIKIFNIKTGEVVYQQNNNKLMHPASNMKLFTTAAALLYLGPEYVFETKFVVDSSVAINDTINSNIYLVGSGDPSFCLGDLQVMVAELKSKGIRHITGDIICDDLYLDDLNYGSGWMWDDQPSSYHPPFSALTINRNTLDIYALPADTVGMPVKIRAIPFTNYVQINNQSNTIDSLTFKKQLIDTSSDFEPLTINRRWQTQENVIDIKGMMLSNADEAKVSLNIVEPTFYFATLFKEYCTQADISIGGQIRIGKAPEKNKILASSESAPVTTLIYEINKPSDNLYAELMLKAVGAAVKGVPGSANKGIEVIEEMLQSWNINPGNIRFTDGSGVSRYNLVSADAVVGLLVNMYRNFAVRNEFMASLPIAGIDGTLSNRMQNSSAFKILHAKTGSLNGVSTLGGYTVSADKDVLAFSILMSNFLGSTDDFRNVQDRICDVITRYKADN